MQAHCRKRSRGKVTSTRQGRLCRERQGGSPRALGPAGSCSRLAPPACLQHRVPWGRQQQRQAADEMRNNSNFFFTVPHSLEIRSFPYKLIVLYTQCCSLRTSGVITLVSSAHVRSVTDSADRHWYCHLLTCHTHTAVSILQTHHTHHLI